MGFLISGREISVVVYSTLILQRISCHNIGNPCEITCGFGAAKSPRFLRRELLHCVASFANLTRFLLAHKLQLKSAAVIKYPFAFKINKNFFISQHT